MRIIGEIPHSHFKITVFKTEYRLSVKFEQGFLEQTYKFRESENLKSFADVVNLIDQNFINQVLIVFKNMEAHYLETMKSLSPAQQEAYFEDII
jgi:hypothetical protein